MIRAIECCLLTVSVLAVSVLAASDTAADDLPTSRLPQDTLPAELSCDAIPLGLPSAPAIPADNALSQQRVALGRRLFFDGRLSADGTISCATCHMPASGFASPDRVAVGVGGAAGRRNSPSILNRVFGTTFFWDGRTATLEEQALQPIENPLEMATTVAAVLEKIRADAEYPTAFAAAYEDGLTAPNLARALASFERVLVSGGSPVDLFQAGGVSALTSHSAADCGYSRVVDNVGSATAGRTTPTTDSTTRASPGVPHLPIGDASKSPAGKRIGDGFTRRRCGTSP